MIRKLCIPFVFVLWMLNAQPANKFALTVDNIMRGPALVGYEPSQVRWSAASDRIYFQWKQAGDPEHAPMDTYVVGRDGSGLRKLTEDEAKLAPPAMEGDKTKDGRLTVYTRNGDLYTYDNTTGAIRQLTKTADMEAGARFLADGKRIAFTRANNLYVMSLDGA